MGKCNCKGDSTTSVKSFLKSGKTNSMLDNKLIYLGMAGLILPFGIPIVTFLAIRSKIIGKPIDLTKLFTIFSKKKRNKPNLEDE